MDEVVGQHTNVPYPQYVNLTLQYAEDQECNVIMLYQQPIMSSLKSKIQSITGFTEPVFTINGVRFGRSATAKSLHLTDGSLIMVHEHERATIIAVDIVSRHGTWPELRNCLVDCDTPIAAVAGLYLGRFPNIDRADICFFRHGKAVCETDTLRTLGMVNDSQLEVVGINEVEAISDGDQQSVVMHNGSNKQDTLFITEPQGDRADTRTQILRPANCASPLPRQQPTRPPLPAKPDDHQMALSEASQQSLERIKESDAYNEAYDNRTYAYRQSNVLHELEEPVLIKPCSVIRQVDWKDERPTYVFGQKRAFAARDVSRSFRNANEYTSGQIRDSRPRRIQDYRSQRSLDRYEGHISNPAPRMCNGSSFRSAPRHAPSSNRQTEKRRRTEKLMPASHASLLDADTGVHSYSMESSRRANIVSADVQEPSAKRRRHNTPPFNHPDASQLLLIFKHGQGSFPDFRIRTRSDLPLSAAMDGYARRHGCHVEELDFRSETGRMFWDGVTDTPAKYGLNDGDTVVVWSADERKKQARLRT